MHLTIIAERNGVPLIDEAKRGARIAVRLLENVARRKRILKKGVFEITFENRFPGVIRESIEACRLTCDETLTPTAAIAGAIADVVADAVREMGATKVVVDNGGDIAIRLEGCESVKVGIAPRTNVCTHVVEVTAGNGIGGIATSGLGGVGFTKGVASAATTIAERASLADASSTVIGNSTFCEGIEVIHCPANVLDPDSDMGNQAVTLKVGKISKSSAICAIKNGLKTAKRLMKTGMIKGAIVFVGEEVGMVPPGVARRLDHRSKSLLCAEL
jgi:hypothetical protein